MPPQTPTHRKHLLAAADSPLPPGAGKYSSGRYSKNSFARKMVETRIRKAGGVAGRGLAAVEADAVVVEP